MKVSDAAAPKRAAGAYVNADALVLAATACGTVACAIEVGTAPARPPIADPNFARSPVKIVADCFTGHHHKGPASSAGGGATGFFLVRGFPVAAGAGFSGVSARGAKDRCHRLVSGSASTKAVWRGSPRCAI